MVVCCRAHAALFSFGVPKCACRLALNSMYVQGCWLAASACCHQRGGVGWCKRRSRNGPGGEGHAHSVVQGLRVLHADDFLDRMMQTVLAVHKVVAGARPHRCHGTPRASGMLIRAVAGSEAPRGAGAQPDRLLQLVLRSQDQYWCYHCPRSKVRHVLAMQAPCISCHVRKKVWHVWPQGPLCAIAPACHELFLPPADVFRGWTCMAANNIF